MQTKPHVERLVRLLHNRVVRRVLHSHPHAAALLLVGDLDDGTVLLRPTAVWAADGSVLQPIKHDPGALGRWRALTEDLRPEFALLARVSPAELFVPYVLNLSQLDLRLAKDEEAGFAE
ncbi:MAG TPA: hypothetical protein VLR26_17455 [Frankiaceae bacterium]|nr:hypothetical protein [Frankiaceae bacterium]